MVELGAGDLAATWAPEHGMIGTSLRHRGGELLGQRGGLAAYLAKGSAFGIPLLAPWANRLDGLRYGDVTLDPARVKGGAQGLENFAYVTVGTGIGVGSIVRGRSIFGMNHTELGHIRVARKTGDTFAGSCSFHGDCI